MTVPRIRVLRGVLALLLLILGGVYAWKLFTRGPLDDLAPSQVEDLRAWALEVIKQHSNQLSAEATHRRISGSVPREFRPRAPYSDWSLVVYSATSNRPAYLALQSLGGFASMQIVVGPKDLQLGTNRFCQIRAPGVYIKRTGDPTIYQ